MSKTVTFDKIIFCLFPLCLMLSSLSFVSPGDFLSFLLFPQETGLSQSFETIHCCPRGHRKQAINEWPKILPNEKWPNSPSSIAAFYQIIFQIDCKKYLTWQNLVTIHQQLILGSFYIIKSFYIKKLVGWCPKRRSAFYHLDIISIWQDDEEEDLAIMIFEVLLLFSVTMAMPPRWETPKSKLLCVHSTCRWWRWWWRWWWPWW